MTDAEFDVKTAPHGDAAGGIEASPCASPKDARGASAEDSRISPTDRSPARETESNETRVQDAEAVALGLRDVSDDAMRAAEAEEASTLEANAAEAAAERARSVEEVERSVAEMSRLDAGGRAKRCEQRHSELDSFLDGAARMAAFVKTQVGTCTSSMKVDSSKTGKPNSKSQGKRRKKGESDSALDEDSNVLTVRQPAAITGGKLRDYQLSGLAWLLSVDMNGFNGILADEMGLGKTIQLISFYAAMREQGVKGPMMVVAPLSTIPNWVREFERWWPSQPVLMYHGNKERRKAMRSRGGELDPRRQSEPDFPVVITSYEIIIKDSAELGRGRYSWKYLCVDEGHRLKNKDCLLIKKLAEYNSDRRVLLTGTPLQNNLTELWSLLNFLMKDQFMDADTFLRHFELDDLVDDEHAMLRAQKRDAVVSKLHEVLRPYVLRRLKGDVDIGIPPKREVVVYCPLTPVQRELYQLALDGKLASTVAARNTGGGIVDVRRSGSLQNKLMQLRKACNHPFLIEDHTCANGISVTDERIVRFSGKMQVLDKMLHELKSQGRQVLIFSQWVRTLDILQDYIEFRGWKSRSITGSTDVFERQQFMDDFNTDPDIFLFLLSTRAGGLGINLIAADTVIIFDSDWNPFADMQAQDRCHRIGQTKPVAVFRLIAENSAENHILRAACHKRKLELVTITRGNYQVEFGDGEEKQGTSSAGGSGASEEHGSKLTEGQLRRMLAPLIDLRKDERGGINDVELAALLDRERLVASVGSDDETDDGAASASARAVKGSSKKRRRQHAVGLPLVGDGYQILRPIKGTSIGSTHNVC